MPMAQWRSLGGGGVSYERGTPVGGSRKLLNDLEGRGEESSGRIEKDLEGRGEDSQRTPRHGHLDHCPLCDLVRVERLLLSV